MVTDDGWNTFLALCMIGAWGVLFVRVIIGIGHRRKSDQHRSDRE